MMLTELEHQALVNFVAHYRPKLSNCREDHCLVFPAHSSMPGHCCQQINIPSVNKIIKKTFHRTGADAKGMGSTLIRKVMVTLLRGPEQDPLRNLANSRAASHSLATADRYYDKSRRDIDFLKVA